MTTPPPPTPQSSASCSSPTGDDARPYALIPGKRFEVLKGYPKGAEGWLLNDPQFIDDLNKYVVRISVTLVHRTPLCGPNTEQWNKESLGGFVGTAYQGKGRVSGEVTIGEGEGGHKVVRGQ